MPNTAEIYRQNAIIEYRNQLNAKLAAQHVQREGEEPMYVLEAFESRVVMATRSSSTLEIS